MEFLIIPLIMGLAAVVQGATGFGFGIVSVAILSNIISVREASVSISIANWCLNVMIFYRLREHFRLGNSLPLLISIAVGVPFGVYFLVKADPLVLRSALGCLLIAAAVYNMIPRFSEKRWHPVYAGVPCGLFSGALSGAFSSGGPPVVAFVSTQGYDKYRFSATLQVAFITSTTLRVLEFARRGLFTRQILLQSAVGLGLVIVGALAGLRLLKKVSDKTLLWLIRIFLIAMGLRYLIGVAYAVLGPDGA